MKKKILLVEDDAFVQFMMGEILSTLGYQYDIAKNGQECQPLLFQQPEQYGVVLMDIHMPEVSGIDATKAIRSYSDDPPRSIPIVAVTADPHFNDEQVISRYGMDGCLSKPITASEINEVTALFC